VHLKEVDQAVLQQSRAQDLSFGQAVARGVMCEPPLGGHIELSPRDDFMPFFLHPRADRQTISEREGLELHLEPHTDDFIEDGRAAVDMIRGINSPRVSFLYCAPHIFHMGGDVTGVMECAGPLLTHLQSRR
jgi:hypothetical protein